MVYLVYEDDYGSTFSPYFLTTIYRDKEKAIAYVKSRNGLAMLKEFEDKGDNLESYPHSLGGLFSEDW
jgi:hypothetical protein